jgi:hypothetical protein
VNRTGRYLLHAGEVVMNPMQQARLAANLLGGAGGTTVVNNYYTTYKTDNKTTNVSMSNSTAEASRAGVMSIYGLVMY